MLDVNYKKSELEPTKLDSRRQTIYRFGENRYLRGHLTDSKVAALPPSAEDLATRLSDGFESDVYSARTKSNLET